MKFDDDLPSQCPPSDHTVAELEMVYRVLRGPKACDADWLSYMQLGKVGPKKVDPCRLASLSLQANLPAVQKLLKLPNFRSATHAAILAIPATAGVHKLKGSHYDFWKAQAANMNDCVIKIEMVQSG